MGEYQVFPWKKLCLTVAKDFIGGGGLLQDFPSNFFCFSAESFHRGFL